MHRARHLLLTTPALFTAYLASALAGPNGATVVGGAASVQGQGTASVVVNQTTPSAIINWNTFNIGAGESTRINMPTASSVELDRITGGLGPSQIFGTLSSNGRVFLVNPDGILFGQGAKVNVGGLLATTHDISNADFMGGRYNFTGPGNPAASIVNQGSITAQNEGFAALVAPGVRNTGTIIATLGQIGLASANQFALDFYGDRLIQLNVGDTIASQVVDVSTGKPLNALVSNEGTLKANGGRVELTAAAARRVVDSVINNTGTIEANTVGTHNGMIVLEAATAASKPAEAPTQTVKVSGNISAVGKRKGTTGGTILVTGENVQVTHANINVWGTEGGGAVLIGGDWGGGHPNASLVNNPSAYLEPYAVPTAASVTIDPATTINASATNSGNGGKVIVWSDNATTFYGTIVAEGTGSSGNGGFVESSGHALIFDGALVNTSAFAGVTGTWLLDPYDLTIDSNAAATITANLAANNVTLQTGASGASGPGLQNPAGSGDILVDANISWSTTNVLTFSAFRNIQIANGVTIANVATVLSPNFTGSPILVLEADNTGTGVGSVLFVGSAKVDFSASVASPGVAAVFYDPIGGYAHPTDFSSRFVAANPILGLGQGLLPYMLVNTATDLENIENNLSGTYALNRNLNLSGINFVPIGNSATPFTGSFYGLSAVGGTYLESSGASTISNLSINSSLTNVGLFGYNRGTLSGFTLENVSIVGNSPGSSVGAVAGTNAGTISDVLISGSVSSNGQSSDVGGIAGTNANTGNVFGVTSSASVAGTANSQVGSLVGLNNGSIFDSSYVPPSTANPPQPTLPPNTTVSTTEQVNSGFVTLPTFSTTIAGSTPPVIDTSTSVRSNVSNVGGNTVLGNFVPVIDGKNIPVGPLAENLGPPLGPDCEATVFAMIGNIELELAGKPATFTPNNNPYENASGVATPSPNSAPPIQMVGGNEPLTVSAQNAVGYALNQSLFEKNSSLSTLTSFPAIIGGTITGQNTNETLPHFMLAIGIDPQTKNIIANDPLTGKQVEINPQSNTVVGPNSVQQFHAVGFVGLNL